MPLRQRMELWIVRMSSCSCLGLTSLVHLENHQSLRQEKKTVGNPWGLLLGHWAVYTVHTVMSREFLKEAPHTWSGRRCSLPSLPLRLSAPSTFFSRLRKSASVLKCTISGPHVWNGVIEWHPLGPPFSDIILRLRVTGKAAYPWEIWIE